ncbi:cell death-inducing p53-target protein 1-like [Anarrhichthys ocellatus]|uniref:cell death-inducing p53-target protein 1-like n=1 Tax=Anarrhichthys ocellatus TaxID=433405 RepID=UPI0012ED3860|nr:cell death-inducing p53-target protein 1-like [Anarrhichthys ocellatus]
MESLATEDELFPTPPLYFLPGESHSGPSVRFYHIHSPSTPPPPSSTFSPGVGCTTETHAPLTDAAKDSRLLNLSASPQSPVRRTRVSYEMELFCYPALTTCPSCQTRVTTQVTYKVGRFAWLMCLVFVFCGLVFGCCLIPFFVNYFKDTSHTCPRCKLFLHMHRRTCCE